MNYAKHLGRLLGTSFVLGVCYVASGQALAVDRSWDGQDSMPVAESLASLSFEVAVNSTSSPIFHQEVPNSLVEPDGNTPPSSQRVTVEEMQPRSSEMWQGVLIANDYTPPDNGGPDGSRGSGTR